MRSYLVMIIEGIGNSSNLRRRGVRGHDTIFHNDALCLIWRDSGCIRAGFSFSFNLRLEIR